MFGMLEQLKYVNHLGEELAFGRDGLFINENELRDFLWAVTSSNNKISGFNRTMQNKVLPVRIACVSEADGIIKRNALFEIPEKDILALQPGRFELDGYYLTCYINGSKKDRYSISEKYMAVDLNVVIEDPVWIRETKIEIRIDENWKPEYEESAHGYDFPLGFPFGLLPSVNRAVSIENDAFVESDFRMVVHGPVSYPTVIVNDHEYQVNTNVDDGSTLTIDTSRQKVFITDADGETTSVFNERGRDYYIFQKIPAGNLSIHWDNTFDVDLYLFDERSEPKWRKQVK